MKARIICSLLARILFSPSSFPCCLLTVHGIEYSEIRLIEIDWFGGKYFDYPDISFIRIEELDIVFVISSSKTTKSAKFKTKWQNFAE